MSTDDNNPSCREIHRCEQYPLQPVGATYDPSMCNLCGRYDFEYRPVLHQFLIHHGQICNDPDWQDGAASAVVVDDQPPTPQQQQRSDGSDDDWIDDPSWSELWDQRSTQGMNVDPFRKSMPHGTRARRRHGRCHIRNNCDSSERLLGELNDQVFYIIHRNNHIEPAVAERIQRHAHHQVRKLNRQLEQNTDLQIMPTSPQLTESLTARSATLVSSKDQNRHSNSKSNNRKQKRGKYERTEAEPAPSSSPVLSSHRQQLPVAPLDRREVAIGTLLGIGGFACVFEVDDIRLLPSQRQHSSNSSSYSKIQPAQWHYTQEEQTARMHLQQQQKLHDHDSGRQAYAMKFLHHGVAKSPKRLHLAIMDLVREARILVALQDHPNIIRLWGGCGTIISQSFSSSSSFCARRSSSVRGTNQGSTSSFGQRSSSIKEPSYKYTDYFVILDRIIETLECRIGRTWRKQLVQYQRRRAWFPVARFYFQAKMEQLWQQRLQAAYDLSSAVAFMHQHGIMHRDIKSNNVGFDVHGTLKLFDMGLSTVLPRAHRHQTYLHQYVGTQYYMAPEIARKEPYTISADVYSYGITLWEILSLASPTSILQSSDPTKWWQQQQQQHHGGLFHNVRNTELPICSCWPPEIISLIERCLSHQSSKRPTMDQVHFILQQQLNLKHVVDIPQLQPPRVPYCWNSSVSSLMSPKSSGIKLDPMVFPTVGLSSGNSHTM